jgi:hypothetical protein
MMHANSMLRWLCCPWRQGVFGSRDNAVLAEDERQFLKDVLGPALRSQDRGQLLQAWQAAKARAA